MDNGNFLSDLLDPRFSNAGQTNRDAFYNLARQRFTPAHQASAVEEEAARLRELASDIKALKDAKLI